MKKIPTLFKRDPMTMFRTLLPEARTDTVWVLTGQGVATRKFNGTAILVRGGQLYKRRMVKANQSFPVGFNPVDHDPETGNTAGWMPTRRHDRDDQWLYEAWDFAGGRLEDGTYELCGPKVQGNPEGFDKHLLIRHGHWKIKDAPRDFVGLRDFLKDFPHEGIVWHHPDGRMAKIKRRDFYR